MNRSRWRSAESPEIKDDLERRWRVAHDMCSVYSAHKAFAFVKERDNDDFGTFLSIWGFELYSCVVAEAVWQLIQLSNWFIASAQDLLRECSLLYDAEEGQIKS